MRSSETSVRYTGRVSCARRAALPDGCSPSSPDYGSIARRGAGGHCGLHTGRRRRGVELELWDAAHVAAATGTRRYRAATFDHRGGLVNPRSLVRGLAAAALDAGAAIHGSTAALALERDGSGWCIPTATGRVRADKVVLATDGYSDDLWPRLRQSIVPIFSSLVATRPLPPGLAAAILPHRDVVYESGNITVYYRRDRDGRLLMGGRGRQRSSRDIRDYRRRVRYAEKLWPSLAGIAWTHWWNGQFALTPDYYPQLHAPAPGLYIALGYSGRGVALATAIGAELADATTGTPLDELVLPVVPVRGIALHRLWRAGVAARVAWGPVRDRLGG